MSNLFEAVFYSEPVPSSLKTLTLMGLIFDRVHFPGVYIPTDGIDEDAVTREIERLTNLPTRHDRIGSAQMINCMVYALGARHLQKFCVFTGRPGYPGLLEPGAEDLLKEFEQLIYGPPPPGFSPTYRLGFAKGLPGDDEAAVNGPSWLSYPPNALLYAARTGMVLINDNAALPFLSGGDVRSNARVLSTAMALESVRLVLPNVRALQFEELAEFREQTRSIVVPFRIAMLKLSRKLNDAIVSDATLDDVQKEAAFLAQTTVLPSLEELRAELMVPTRPWYRRIVDFAKDVPELVGNYATVPAPLATARVLAAIGGILADVRNDQLERQGIVKRGPYHYLLKVEELNNG
jgi:hypothetical protein